MGLFVELGQKLDTELASFPCTFKFDENNKERHAEVVVLEEDSDSDFEEQPGTSSNPTIPSVIKRVGDLKNCFTTPDFVQRE